MENIVKKNGIPSIKHITDILNIPMVNFNKAMIEKYMEHVEEKGHSWLNCSVEFLEDKLEQQMVDVAQSNQHPDKLESLALLILFIWYRKKFK